MLKKLIFIENKQSHQFNEETELIKYLMGTEYYNQTEKNKIKQMKLNAIAKCLGTNLEVIELNKEENNKIDIEKKFVIYDEKTYVLSLLLTGRAMLLERLDSNVYTGTIDKSKITDNYIIVNTFAKNLLKQYINDFYA